MSTIELLISHLNSNIPTFENRISPSIIKITKTPYCVYEIVLEKDITTLGDLIGETIRIQLSVYDKSYSGVKSLKDAIKNALYGFEHFPNDLYVLEDYEDDTKLYKQIIDFQFNI